MGEWTVRPGCTSSMQSARTKLSGTTDDVTHRWIECVPKFLPVRIAARNASILRKHFVARRLFVARLA